MMKADDVVHQICDALDRGIGISNANLVDALKSPLERIAHELKRMNDLEEKRIGDAEAARYAQPLGGFSNFTSRGLR
jgi:hypothetical protein